jgi:hypothetical protein
MPERLQNAFTRLPRRNLSDFEMDRDQEGNDLNGGENEKIIHIFAQMARMRRETHQLGCA